MESDHVGVDDLGSGCLEVKKKHRSSSKFTLQRFSGSPSHKTPNLSSRSHTNYSSDSSRWCDRPQCPPQSTNANFGVDESGNRETTKVRHDECVDVGASNLKSGFSALASEHVVKKPEELLLAEETSEPPKSCKIDRIDSSGPRESSNCSSGLAKFADLFYHVKDPQKAEPVGSSTALADSISLSCSNNELEVPVTSSSDASVESQTALYDHAPASIDFGGVTAEQRMIPAEH